MDLQLQPKYFKETCLSFVPNFKEVGSLQPNLNNLLGQYIVQCNLQEPDLGYVAMQRAFIKAWLVFIRGKLIVNTTSSSNIYKKLLFVYEQGNNCRFPK